MGDALKPRTVLAAVAMAVLLCVAGATLPPVRSAARRLASLGAPFYRTTLGLKRLAASIREIGQLRARVAELEAENRELASARIAADERGVEAGLSDKQATAAATVLPGAQPVVARVLFRAPSGLLDAVTIDKGARDGVQIHDAVLVDGFFAGSVTSTGDGTAQVLLATNPSLLTPVLFAKGRAQGLLRANLEGLIVSDVPSSADIASGEAVLTNGIGGTVPPGIPIGTVDSILSDRSDILKRVRIVSPVPFRALAYVAVVHMGATP